MNGQCLLSLLLLWNTLVNLALMVVSSSTDTRIVVTIPVNPVKEQGLLSVHCQVWGLLANHQVTLLRKLTNDKVELLSMNDNVLAGVDENVYLAVRQLEDGSNVYFLSITGVKIQDQGQYSCKVEELATTVTESNQVIGVDSKDITVRYFPIMQPICTYTKALEVQSGTTVTLNCTSEISNPPVKIDWIHAGTNEVIESKQIQSDIVTYSVLKVTLYSRKDVNRVFLCRISSPVFPDRQETCHVGPFTVLPNPDEIIEEPIIAPLPPTDVKTKINVKGDPGPGKTTFVDMKAKCAKQCSYDTAKQFPWIIAFVVAVILTILFLVIGILLYVSYIRNKTNMSNALQRRRHPDEIYSELDIKPADAKVYMPLELRDKFCQDRQSIHYSDIPKM